MRIAKLLCYFVVYCPLFRWGIEKVFNGVLPTSDYYPSTTNPTKKLCIIDSGVWANHPDLKGSSFTAADPNQDGNIQSACSHGTVGRLLESSKKSRFTNEFLLVCTKFRVSFFSNISLFLIYSACRRNCGSQQ